MLFENGTINGDIDYKDLCKEEYAVREDLKMSASLKVKVLLSWMGGRGLKFKKNSLFTLLNRMLGPTINLSFILIILQSKRDKI